MKHQDCCHACLAGPKSTAVRTGAGRTTIARRCPACHPLAPDRLERLGDINSRCSHCNLGAIMDYAVGCGSGHDNVWA
jgi:hypothetical protein